MSTPNEKEIDGRDQRYTESRAARAARAFRTRFSRFVVFELHEVARGRGCRVHPPVLHAEAGATRVRGVRVKRIRVRYGAPRPERRTVCAGAGGGGA